MTIRADCIHVTSGRPSKAKKIINCQKVGPEAVSLVVSVGNNIKSCIQIIIIVDKCQRYTLT